MNKPLVRSHTVFQGEFEVSDDPSICLVTILGSCIAACIFDPVRGIGGLNHFLLPEGPAGGAANLRYGAHSMELLINGLLRRGAERAQLRAKLFGGARMMNELADIGGANAEFALSYLSDENIPCLGQSLLGKQARRIRFWPTTGRVQQLLVRQTDVAPPPVAPKPQPRSDDVELF